MPPSSVGKETAFCAVAPLANNNATMTAMKVRTLQMYHCCVDLRLGGYFVCVFQIPANGLMSRNKSRSGLIVGNPEVGQKLASRRLLRTVGDGLIIIFRRWLLFASVLAATVAIVEVHPCLPSSKGEDHRSGFPPKQTWRLRSFRARHRSEYWQESSLRHAPLKPISIPAHPMPGRYYC